MERIVICLMVIFLGTVAHKSNSQRQDRRLIRLRQLLETVDELNNYVNDLDPEFLPAPQDVKKHCELSAFSCFQKAQLKPANTGDNGKKIDDLIKRLKRKLPPTNAGKRQKRELEAAPVDSAAVTTPQNEYIELHRKGYGYHLDYHEKKRKKESREVHERSKKAKKMTGLKAELCHKQRHAEKIQMKKTVKMREKRHTKQKNDEKTPQGAAPAYLLDREGQSRAKVLSNMIKQKWKKKARKWRVPLSNVQAQGETEVLEVIRTGKRKKKAWKRTVTKVCFVGVGFTRKPPKYERFIRPKGLRFKKPM
ncbi:Ribosome biogenesis protein NSA2 like protein [Tupaia chinensis]|uniref:Ribosome biogenesis protein NSA2 like protein n=1 Tax=Tupaia chinensis TaxID=246437 RepID=L9KJG9_TUPCH|nr:Ribosome biogenesis protein NSA2 like protein [Tupaia chinensis]